MIQFSKYTDIVLQVLLFICSNSAALQSFSGQHRDAISTNRQEFRIIPSSSQETREFYGSSQLVSVACSPRSNNKNEQPEQKGSPTVPKPFEKIIQMRKKFQSVCSNRHGFLYSFPVNGPTKNSNYLFNGQFLPILYNHSYLIFFTLNFFSLLSDP